MPASNNLECSIVRTESRDDFEVYKSRAHYHCSGGSVDWSVIAYDCFRPRAGKFAWNPAADTL